jgi:dienelactone hydrolase
MNLKSKLALILLLVTVNSHAFLLPTKVEVKDSRLGKIVEVPVETWTNWTPGPTIILAHTCAGIIRPMDTDWANTIKSWGYNVVIPDSFNPRGVKETCLLPRTVSMTQRNEDISSVAEWVWKQSWHKGLIGLIGFSNGGWLVLEASNRPLTNKIAAMVAYYPWCDVKFHGKPKIPVQIHIGKQDSWTPAEQCEPLGSVVELNIYENAYHSFDRYAPRRVKPGHGEKLHVLEYNPMATKLAAERTKDFFQHYLKD